MTGQVAGLERNHGRFHRNRQGIEMQAKIPDEPIEVFDVDNMRIGFNPSVETRRGKTNKSLTIDFQVKGGWYRFRLEDIACDLFNRYYSEQVTSRYEQEHTTRDY